jgi:Transglycosylase SLT domain
MAKSRYSGLGVFATVSGAILVYSGVKGYSISTSIRDLLSGKSPDTGQTAVPISPAGNELQTMIESGSLSGTVEGALGPSNSSAQQNQKLGQAMAAQKGWTGAQWNALNQLIMDESGWRNNAQNPTSTAYGIGQFLDSTWASFGPKTSNPSLQIAYTLAYIEERYGTPANALAHENAYHWY